MKILNKVMNNLFGVKLLFQNKSSKLFLEWKSLKYFVNLLFP